MAVFTLQQLEIYRCMSLRIVFMGTPEFAVASLAQLHQSHHQVVAVVTVADKPAGRGQKLQVSAVKNYAETHQLPLLQPEKLRDAHFLEELKELNADLFVVVAFRMLPEVVWAMPKYGTINLHGSLLPQYRGAAPIHWAVINGEKLTGCTTFFISHDIDTGAVIDQISFEIGADETTGDVHDRMMMLGANLLLRTVNQIESGAISPKDQAALAQDFQLKHAPKLNRELAKIDWRADAATVHNQIRGLSPFPVAWTMFGSDVFKVYRSQRTDLQSNRPVGQLIQDKKQLYVVCGNGELLEILEIQPAGKKRMPAAAFLQGYDVSGARFE
jgi:methionyl-tRNA formyltransferase